MTIFFHKGSRIQIKFNRSYDDSGLQEHSKEAVCHMGDSQPAFNHKSPKIME